MPAVPETATGAFSAGGCQPLSFAEQPRLVPGAASEEEAGVVPFAVNYWRRLISTSVKTLEITGERGTGAIQRRSLSARHRALPVLRDAPLPLFPLPTRRGRGSRESRGGAGNGRVWHSW